MASIRSIGNQLRHIRKDMHLSAPKVAEKSGIHPNTLRALETGKGNIELSRLLSICDSLGMELMVVPKKISEMQAADSALTSTELTNELRDLMRVGK